MRAKGFFVKLVLKDEIIEDRPEFPFFKRKEQIDLRSILKVIETCRVEKRIQALVLVLKNLSIGWGQIEEIHQELDRLHETGKRSLAYLEDADNKAYYLACGAQQIYMPPSSNLELTGLRAEILFFKNLLEYLGVQPEIFNLGAYKSAAEIFTREQMSDENRQMTDAILSDLQQRLKEKIASRRSITPDRVQELIDEGPYTARRALTIGLVDGLRYEDEMEAIVKEWKAHLVELPASKLPLHEGLLKRLITFRRPQIAYMVAEGIVTTGESRRGRGKQPVLGSDTLAGFLRHARKRKRIKAVVLRVNSPGGSALASDLMWREIKLTDKKKPVIVSFSNLAASGGYYIATGGRHVVAMPGTLTGSIGILGGKFNLHGLLAKIGVTVDHLEKGKRSGYLSPARPFSEDEAQVVRLQMKEFYEEHFLKKVAESRQKSVEAVRELAEGRVWTGAQALQHGLLDAFGGITDALETAKHQAGIPKAKKVRIVRYTKRRTLRDLLSFPLIESLSTGRILALMLEEWDIH